MADSIGGHFLVAALVLAVIGFAGAACGVPSASKSIAGSELYRACVNCHGAAGEGSTVVGPPRLAGLPQWYVASGLQRFQDGLRGKHPDDSDGLRMRAMARQMMTREEITAVAGYVATFAPVTNPATLRTANAAAGGDIFGAPSHGALRCDDSNHAA